MSKINQIIVLAIGGLLFSGYLSAVKLFSHSCAIDSGCSYFLGYPTCYYGFGFFVLIFILALSNKFRCFGGKVMNTARLHALRTVVSAAIIFSGYFSFVEIKEMFTQQVVYGALIMPTCFYGLIFYIWILVLAFKLQAEEPDNDPEEERKPLA